MSSHAYRGQWMMVALLLGVVGLAKAAAPEAAGVFHSPVDAKYSPNGAMIAVSDRTAGQVAILDAASGKCLRCTPVGGKTGSVAWSADSSKVYVTNYNGGFVAEINAADGAIVRKIAVGPYPNGVAVVSKKGLLLVTNTGLHDLSVVDLASGKEKTRVKMVREPYTIAVTADESTAVVSNLLPAGAASEPTITAALCIVNLDDLSKVELKLPPNSGCVRQVAVSSDGKWAYAVHTVGRTTLPATQLDRGWVNTNGLSVIDLKTKKHYATLLLDSLAEGAADPWGLAIDKDNKTMWISLSGTHQIARIDLAGLHGKLEGGAAAPAPAVDPKAPQPKKSYGSATVWDEIKADASKRSELVNDLSALYVANLIQRIPTPGKGPRGVALSPDGSKLAVAQYFGGDVSMLDTATAKFASTSIAIGKQPAVDEARRGEMIFHDANYTFQKWLTCATCHPNEARVDGMNWDLTNDGIGNPKNNKSLVFSYLTPPMMWLSVREGMDEAVSAGFRFNSQVPPEKDVEAVRMYLKSLKTDPSPFLVDGKMSEKALRGKKLFEEEAVGCMHCHAGDQHTTMKKFNVGTHGALDHPGEDAFDTPSLKELWRTGPYLHDGRAPTLQEMMTKFNDGDKHGKTKHLTPAQLDDLVEYLLSL